MDDPSVDDTAVNTTAEIEIRAGDGRDTGSVLGMLDGAVAWLAEHGHSGQWGTRPWSEDPQRTERVHRMVADDELWIARIGGLPAGALVLTERTPGYAPPAGEDEVYVRLLVTDRAFAGRRVGNHLLDHARRRARDRGVTLIRVDCWTGGGGRLVDYYRAAGFTPTVAFAQDGWRGQILEQRLLPS